VCVCVCSADAAAECVLLVAWSHEGRVMLSPAQPLLLEGDVKLEVHHERRELWHTWLNTAHLPEDGVYSLGR
jgi:hypothetical protein